MSRSKSDSPVATTKSSISKHPSPGLTASSLATSVTERSSQLLYIPNDSATDQSADSSTAASKREVLSTAAASSTTDTKTSSNVTLKPAPRIDWTQYSPLFETILGPLLKAQSHLHTSAESSAPAMSPAASSEPTMTTKPGRFDTFQMGLFSLLNNASDENIDVFMQYKGTQLNRFLIALFIASLTESHPLRTGLDIEHYRESDGTLASSATTGVLPSEDRSDGTTTTTVVISDEAVSKDGDETKEEERITEESPGMDAMDRASSHISISDESAATLKSPMVSVDFGEEDKTSGIGGSSVKIVTEDEAESISHVTVESENDSAARRKECEDRTMNEWTQLLKYGDTFDELVLPLTSLDIGTGSTSYNGSTQHLSARDGTVSRHSGRDRAHSGSQSAGGMLSSADDEDDGVLVPESSLVSARMKDDSSLLCSVSAELVAPMMRIRGDFNVRTDSIDFIPHDTQPEENNAHIGAALLANSALTSPDASISHLPKAKYSTVSSTDTDSTTAAAAATPLTTSTTTVATSPPGTATTTTISVMKSSEDPTSSSGGMFLDYGSDGEIARVSTTDYSGDTDDIPSSKSGPTKKIRSTKGHHRRRTSVLRRGKSSGFVSSSIGGSSSQYWVCTTACSSFQHVGGNRYRVMNALNHWKISELTQLYNRRYRLRKVAIELFFTDDTSWFFQFFNVENKKKVFKTILRLSPRNLFSPHSSTLLNIQDVDRRLLFSNKLWNKPKYILDKSKLTSKWIRREISNFEYLMQLNIIAGRTMNDLTQYPVMPCVLTDFHSLKLNLRDHKVYRDLSKPIGALNPDRLAMFLDRYESIMEDYDRTDPKEENNFIYGSHYSSIGVVLYYLIRMEPFTTYCKEFQGGHFDHADRLFHSIYDMWLSSTKNTSDVKELIPEFYFLPDFLTNSNELDLGTKTDGSIVSDVVLPPWANGSAVKFVTTMRDALESEYVSQHLHEWIDLVFGYKQRLPHALEAHNLFHPSSYEDNIDLDMIEDLTIRKAILAQIDSFGQTPSQLFTKPHSKRLNSDEIVGSIYKSRDIRHYGSFSLTTSVKDGIGVCYLYLRESDKLLFAVLSDLSVHKYPFHTKSMKLEVKSKYSGKAGGISGLSSGFSKLFGSSGDSSSHRRKRKADKKKLGHGQLTMSLGLSNRSCCFAVCEELNLLFVCGFEEDSSLVIWDLNKMTTVEMYQNMHGGLVSCVACDRSMLVTGSFDASVKVWDLNPDSGASSFSADSSISSVPSHTSAATEGDLFGSGPSAAEHDASPATGSGVHSTSDLGSLLRRKSLAESIDLSSLLQPSSSSAHHGGSGGSSSSSSTVISGGSGGHTHSSSALMGSSLTGSGSSSSSSAKRKYLTKEPRFWFTNQIGKITSVDVSLKAGMIVCSDDSGEINLYNSSTGDHLNKLMPFISIMEVQSKPVIGVTSPSGAAASVSLAGASAADDDEKKPPAVEFVATGEINLVKVSPFGDVICYSRDGKYLFSFSAKGELIKHRSTRRDKLYALEASKNGKYVLCGGSETSVTFRDAHSLKIRTELKDAKDQIRCVTLDRDEECLFVGCANGQVLVYANSMSKIVSARLATLDTLGLI